MKIACIFNKPGKPLLKITKEYWMLYVNILSLSESLLMCQNQICKFKAIVILIQIDWYSNGVVIWKSRKIYDF